MKKKHVNQTFPSGSMVRIQGKTLDVNGNPVAQIERFCKQTMNKENVLRFVKKTYWFSTENIGKDRKFGEKSDKHRLRKNDQKSEICDIDTTQSKKFLKKHFPVKKQRPTGGTAACRTEKAGAR